MVTALPILLLLLTTFSLILIRIIRSGFIYFWLIAAIGALFAWSAGWITRLFLPEEFSVLRWDLPGLPLIDWTFTFDPHTWGFSAAVLTLLLANILISAVRGGDISQPRPSWWNLASLTGVSAASLIVTASGSLVGFQITWALMLVLEGLLWLPHLNTSQDGASLAAEFGLRFSAIWLLFLAAARLMTAGQGNSFELNDPLVFSLTMLAAGLRLGIFPPGVTPASRIQLAGSLEPGLRLAACAPVLMLLHRLSLSDATIPGSGFYWVFAGIAFFHAGTGLIGTRDSIQRQLNWIPAVGALLIFGTLLRLPEWVFQWGLAFLLAGGFMFQYSIRPSWLFPLYLLIALSLLGFPFTPTWMPAELISTAGILPFLASIFLVFAQAFLAAGFLTIAETPATVSVGAERWIWALYLWGLLLLPTMLFLISFQSHPPGWERFDPAALFAAILGAGFAASILVLRRTFKTPFHRWADALHELFSLNWLYRAFPLVLVAIRSLLGVIQSLLEGQAGLIWAFLILLLLLTLYAQFSSGG